MQTVIIIPARVAATRLPGKPLADIGGKPMIAHVVARALEANIGPVYVACDTDAIKNAAEAAGAKAILTDPDLPSGTDRIYAAYVTLGKSYDVVVNLQGDLPLVNSSIISDCLKPLENPAIDIATPVSLITDEAEAGNSSVVKVVANFKESANIATALYFSRAKIPHGAKRWYHHIGIYAYRAAPLKRFVALPPSPLEQVEKLEQLRALEAGMRIGVIQVEGQAPQAVDTPEDLEGVRKICS